MDTPATTWGGRRQRAGRKRLDGRGGVLRTVVLTDKDIAAIEANRADWESFSAALRRLLRTAVQASSNS